MGAVKVSQLEEQLPCGNCSTLNAPPAEVCECQDMASPGSADGEKPLKSGERTVQSISDESTEYAFSNDEDEDVLEKKLAGATLTETSSPSTAPESPQASEDDCSPTASPASFQEATCIIFDWDDTLLPTSFLGDVARVNSASQFTVFGTVAPMEAIPCQEALKQHTDLVRQVLTSACELGHVAIVTSSVRPWVNRSAEQHLPGLDLPQLLGDLGIPVLYAPESWNPSMEHLGVIEAYTACKRTVMEEFLVNASAGRPLRHAISIGDSPVERDAMKQAVERWVQPEGAGEAACCKTIKYMGDPSLKQLSNELQLTMAWLQRIVSCEHGVDMAIDPWDDVESKLRTSFGPAA